MGRESKDVGHAFMTNAGRTSGGLVENKISCQVPVVAGRNEGVGADEGQRGTKGEQEEECHTKATGIKAGVRGNNKSKGESANNKKSAVRIIRGCGCLDERGLSRRSFSCTRTATVAPTPAKMP